MVFGGGRLDVYKDIRYLRQPNDRGRDSSCDPSKSRGLNGGALDTRRLPIILIWDVASLLLCWLLLFRADALSCDHLVEPGKLFGEDVRRIGLNVQASTGRQEAADIRVCCEDQDCVS